MVLRFPGEWRFNPPPDGDTGTSAIPDEAHNDFFNMIQRTATQGDLQELVESRSFSMADLRQRITAVITSYDARVRALVDAQQWVLYPSFKAQLADRLESELNVVRVP